jgi:hypothetical protein
VTNVGGANIGNTYNAHSQPVIVNKTSITNVSYNGGQGGVAATPTAAEKAYASQQHVAPTAAQVQHQQMASTNPGPADRRHGSPWRVQGGGRDAGHGVDRAGRKTRAGAAACQAEWPSPRIPRRAQRCSYRRASRRAPAGAGRLSRPAAAFGAASRRRAAPRASSGTASRATPRTPSRTWQKAPVARRRFVAHVGK